MEPISETQLARLMSASAETDRLSPTPLSEEESIHLALLLSQMAERYPSQDLSDSLEGYQWDYERLVQRYSMQEVKWFLAEYRITPGASFFPRPDECATWIERRREAGKAERRRMAEARDRQQAKRYRESLMSPEEVAWRVARFGYDPFVEKRNGPARDDL
jgi:hypothetical protein